MSNVTIRVFDLSGRLQTIIVDADKDVGNHKIDWTPKSLSAGMYLLQMQAGEHTSVWKIMLLR